MIAKKLKLNFDESNDFIVLGVVSSLPEYILSHRFNQKLHVDFKRYDDFEYGNGKHKYSYAWFFAHFDDYKTDLFLVSNANSRGYLMPKLKNLDYFLLFNSEFEDELEKFFLKSIRNISGVSGVYKIDLKDVRNIELFFEKIELHGAKIAKRIKNNLL